ncbi:MAG: WXG100 family type VII secretion target [Lachnospiraceae bacterium]|nr:WXG100 family type VII secretion target [Lachnospiraceae bacterium]
MAIIGNVQIKVTPQALEEKAAAVTSNINAMQTCFDELEQIINRTGYYWIGNAGDMHRQMYMKQKDAVVEMMRRLSEHPRDLLTIAGQYEVVEQEVRAIGESLSGDVIE